MVDALITHEAGEEADNHIGALATVRELEINCQEDFDFASRLVQLAKVNLKRIDARRTAITKPLLQSKRAVDELFAPALGALNEIERILKGKLGAYSIATTQASAAAMASTALVYAAGGTPTEVIPEPAAARGISVKTSWSFEVVDPEAVPREYCSPDPDKIEAGIWYADTPHTPPRPIPGLRFFLKADVTVRQK